VSSSLGSIWVSSLVLGLKSVMATTSSQFSYTYISRQVSTTSRIEISCCFLVPSNHDNFSLVIAKLHCKMTNGYDSSQLVKEDRSKRMLYDLLASIIGNLTFDTLLCNPLNLLFRSIYPCMANLSPKKSSI